MLQNPIDSKNIQNNIIKSRDNPNTQRLYGLYGISDTKLTPHNTLMQQLQKAIDGGLRIFQYRDKDSKDSEIAGFVGELEAMCVAQQVLFILNDRYELAIKLGVSGLHLGRDEVATLQDIRQSFQGIIGVSCYDSIPMAIRFATLGIDYVAFGAVFTSPTKTNATPCPLHIIQDAKQHIHIPICAIGGIHMHNVSKLPSCDMIAVISSLWNPPAKPTQNFDFITDNASNLITAWRNHNKTIG